MGNLVVDYVAIGRSEEATDLEGRVLKMRRQRVEEKYPETPVVMWNVALILDEGESLGIIEDSRTVFGHRYVDIVS